MVYIDLTEDFWTQLIMFEVPVSKIINMFKILTIPVL